MKVPYLNTFSRGCEKFEKFRADLISRPLKFEYFTYFCTSKTNPLKIPLNNNSELIINNFLIPIIPIYTNIYALYHCYIFIPVIGVGYTPMPAVSVRKTALDISFIGCIQLCAKERAISPFKVSLALYTLGDENNAGSKCQCGVSDIRVFLLFISCFFIIRKWFIGKYY